MHGLRSRVTLAFGLLSLAVSAVLVPARLDRRLDLPRRASARRWRGGGRPRPDRHRGGPRRQGRARHGTPRRPADAQSTASLCLVGGQWYSTSPQLGASTLPAVLIDTVTGGQGATQRVDVDGQLVLAVGVPLSPAHSAFFEVFPLTDLDRTLQTLSTVLVVGAAATAVLGAGLGRSASRLVLRPLAELGSVAAAVAEGRLDARLQTGNDPDLGPLGASFNRAVAELEHRVAADSRFAVDVSHELRTPLTTMLNSMQIIQNREASLPESVREPLALLAEDLERFRGSWSTCSRWPGTMPARASCSRRSTSPTSCGRPPTMQRGARSPSRGRRCTVRGRQAPASNGSSPTSSPTPTRTAGASWPCGSEAGQRPLGIEVDDAGPGVASRPPRPDLRSVRPRVRAPPTERGLGLGLAIVQRHVALHGASRRCRGPTGRRCGFVVELPITEA